MREKTVVAATTLLVAATRIAALARTPWEWDELAFCLGVRDYDVIHHFPHPPGFPLYIAFAKFFALFGLSDFRALQAVVLLGAMALFPLTYLLARQLGFSFGVAFGGALMLVFAPNVWFYGGTAFSDVPTLALTLGACLLVIPSVRTSRRDDGDGHDIVVTPSGSEGSGGSGGAPNDRSSRRPSRPDSSLPLGMTIGCVLLGIAAGFRPQAILVGLVPLFLNRRRMLAGIAIVAAVVIASYLGAALASGPIPKYVDAVKAQQKWVHDVDSYHNPTRPPLAALQKTFAKPTRGAGNADRALPILATVGAALALWKRNQGAATLIMMFVPLNLFSWLMLDFNAASRYVVSYAPMCTILAAEGLCVIARREWIALAASIVIALIFAISGIPTIRALHSETSPLVAGVEWIHANVPLDARLYVSGNLEMHADYYLRDYHVTLVEGSRPTDGFVFDDAPSRRRGAVNFRVPSGPFWEIARQRFFEASVAPPQ